MPDTIDLRSDTVTQPTDAMREAMRTAEVGDDVFDEDPTVQRLQELSARRMGMEAALLVPTGTMANQIAVWLHTRRQGAMACEAGAHIYVYEAGGPALLSNVLVRPIEGTRGVFVPAQIEGLLDEDALHAAQLRLIEIENTHNRAGGTVWTTAQTRAVTRFAHDHRIPVHVDGARIFNAAVAQDVAPADLVRGSDSASFCLSKGLSAPVGSVLCGPEEFIQQARVVRKILGGGMRQAGVLAAPGIVALQTMVDRLKEDHDNARRLAAGLSKIRGLRVDLETVQTNMVMVDVGEAGLGASQVCEQLQKKAIRAAPRDVGPVVRFVTHRHVTRQDVDRVVDAMREVVAGTRAKTGLHERSKTGIRTRAG